VKKKFLQDLDQEGKEYVVCKGGSKGLGNGKHRSVKAFTYTGENSITLT
jgi:GTPase involved in cell partitioning and DNA repair